MYLAIDPGKGARDSIGWCLFGEDMEMIKLGQSTFDAFVELLESWSSLEISQVICEDYKILPHKARSHSGSRVEVVQCIGVIRSWCIRNNFELIFQSHTILATAQNHFQVFLNKMDHNISHQYSAYLHGCEWLMRNKGKKSALQEKVAREKVNGN